MPRLSVIIPNYNGAHLLPGCLDSLRAQSYRDFETVVVDNASTDSSVQLIAEQYPEVRVLSMERNLVFSGAVNAGIRATASELIVLLNNDTETDPRWLQSLVEAADRRPEFSFFASKLMVFDQRDVIHSAGDTYSRSGIPGNRGVWQKDAPEFSHEQEVFGACAGAALYRRQLFREIGLFDEDLIAYCEDVDLNWRARLRGHRCLFVPDAIVYHMISATGGGPRSSYLCGRNFILVMVKDLPAFLWQESWREILAAQLAYVKQSLLHFREPAARAWLRGQLSSLLHLARFSKKRRAIQAKATATADELRKMLS